MTGVEVGAVRGDVLLAEFGPNTTTFVHPGEIFPVRVRTTSHGIAAAVGKVGAAVGTYTLTGLLESTGFGRVSLFVAVVAALGGLITLRLMPESMGRSPEELSETAALPSSAVTPGVAEGRGTSSPRAQSTDERSLRQPTNP